MDESKRMMGYQGAPESVTKQLIIPDVVVSLLGLICFRVC
jgi:hypothetical protein